MRAASFWIPRAEPRSTASAAASRSAGKAVMRAPATNALSPAPRKIIARVSSDRSRRSYSSSSSSSSCAESAFTGGWSSVTIATAPSASTFTNSGISLLSARPHAEGRVQPDNLAVQVLVLENVLHERREVRRAPESLGERDLRLEALADVVAHARKHGRVRRPGRDGDHADAARAEVARDRERHPCHAGLRRAVGGLAD